MTEGGWEALYSLLPTAQAVSQEGGLAPSYPGPPPHFSQTQPWAKNMLFRNHLSPLTQYNQQGFLAEAKDYEKNKVDVRIT